MIPLKLTVSAWRTFCKVLFSSMCLGILVFLSLMSVVKSWGNSVFILKLSFLNHGTFQSVFYGNIYNRYLRVNIMYKIFQIYLTMELFYHHIYFGTNVLWNMLWKHSDIMIPFFLLKIFLWFCYQPVYNLWFTLSLLLLYQGYCYLGCIDG